MKREAIPAGAYCACSRRLGGLLVLALLMLLTGTSYGSTISFFTPTGSTTSGGSVQAQVDFTINAGSVTVTLSNLGQNPTSDAQLIGSLRFTVTGATGSGSLSTLNSGLISDIGANGSYTAGLSDLLTRWTANESGNTITLGTFSGGKPNRLIIGPDSLGLFNGAGIYSNANSSIDNFDPVILGKASFTISIPGVTSASQIGDVVLGFGTNPTTNTITTSAVPIPSAVWLLGSGLLCILGYRRKTQE